MTVYKPRRGQRAEEMAVIKAKLREPGLGTEERHGLERRYVKLADQRDGLTFRRPLPKQRD